MNAPQTVGVVVSVVGLVAAIGTGTPGIIVLLVGLLIFAVGRMRKDFV
jgi:hypothetical protein